MDFNIFASGFCVAICIATLFQKDYLFALINFIFAILNFALYLT